MSSPHEDPHVEDPNGEAYADHGGDPARGETAAQRLDRNFNDVLQETRVVQTGIQVLFAFLLIVPFQARFPDLSEFQRDLYLIVLVLVALSTAFALGPVVTHRLLYGQRAKDTVFLVSHRLLLIALTLLGLALVGGVTLVVDIVLGPIPTAIIAGAFALVILGAWLVVPKMLKRINEGVPD